MGTGLGLYIVINEIKKYGGTVELESKPGKGTKFKLAFPDAPVAFARAKDSA